MVKKLCYISYNLEMREYAELFNLNETCNRIIDILLLKQMKVFLTIHAAAKIELSNLVKDVLFDPRKERIILNF